MNIRYFRVKEEAKQEISMTNVIRIGIDQIVR